MVPSDDRRSYTGHMALAWEGSTELPFTIGGVTKHGWHGTPQNNQDAMAIWVDSDVIIGVVCDGCANAASTSSNSVSMNEVGAQLGCLAVIRAVRDFLRGNAPLDERVGDFIERGLWRLTTQVLGLAGRRPRSGTAVLRQRFLFDFLTHTVLVAIVTLDRYVVLASGDGLIRVNGREIDLSAFAGQYLANTWSSRPRQTSSDLRARLSAVATGPTSSLTSLMLASDGVGEMPEYRSVITQLENNGSGFESVQGLDSCFFREFRRCLGAESEAPENQHHDDRTLVLLRRWPAVSDSSGRTSSEPRRTYSGDQVEIPPTAASSDVLQTATTEHSARQGAWVLTQVDDQPLSSTSPSSDSVGERVIGSEQWPDCDPISVEATPTGDVTGDDDPQAVAKEIDDRGICAPFPSAAYAPPRSSCELPGKDGFPPQCSSRVSESLESPASGSDSSESNEADGVPDADR